MDSEVNKSPVVSLIVPVRNAGTELEVSLTELKARAQELSDLCEIIVVDDGSTDGTAIRLENLVRADSTTKAVLLSGPFGFDSAVLAGLNHATGHAIIWLPFGASNLLGEVRDMLARFREGAEIVSLARSFDKAKKNPKCPFKCLILGQSEGDSCDVMLVSQAAARAMCENAARFDRLAELANWIGFTRATVQFAAETIKSAIAPPRNDSTLCRDEHGLVRKTFIAGIVLISAGALYMIIHAVACLLSRCMPGWAFAMSACAVLFGIQFFAISIILFRLCRLGSTSAAGLGYVVKKTVGFSQPSASGKMDSDDDDDIQPFMLWT